MQETQSLSSTTPAYEATKKEMHARAFPETAAILKRINFRHKRCIEEAMLKTEEGRAELVAIKIKRAKEFDESRRAKAEVHSQEKSRIKQLKLQKAEAARALAAKKKAEQAAQGRGNK